LAIEEFNKEQSVLKFSKSYHLICQERVKKWYHQIYILHRFNHPEYQSYLK